VINDFFGVIYVWQSKYYYLTIQQGTSVLENYFQNFGMASMIFFSKKLEILKSN
jgi:hypothetical protein